jgi:hypothetical protein
MFSCAERADRSLLFTPLSFNGTPLQEVSGALWFSGHLLYFEHFLSSSAKARCGARV